VPAGMAPGTYDLTLYNGDCQEAVLADAFSVITQCLTPTVELAAGSPVELGAPIAFTATIGGTPPFTYTWDFGGPGYGTGLDTRTPVYTYTAYGTYTASVHLANPCGEDQDSLAVEVLCYTPQASFASDSPVELGQPIHFASAVSGTGPFSYTWDFGDGVGASNEANPVYTYTAAGDYTVTLAVEGQCGTDTFGAVVQVISGCEAPEAGFVSDSPVELGTPIYFTSTVTGTGPFTYAWDFGDGVGTSDEANPSYTYTATGTFTVTLFVEGACGEDAASAAVTVLPGQRTYWYYLPIVYR
jgi:PKD repeat protein